MRDQERTIVTFCRLTERKRCCVRGCFEQTCAIFPSCAFWKRHEQFLSPLATIRRPTGYSLPDLSQADTQRFKSFFIIEKGLAILSTFRAITSRRSRRYTVSRLVEDFPR